MKISADRFILPHPVVHENLSQTSSNDYIKKRRSKKDKRIIGINLHIVITPMSSTDAIIIKGTSKISPNQKVVSTVP